MTAEVIALKPSHDVGSPPELRWLPTAELHVDHTYQREVARRGATAIGKLARNFHWSRFAPLVVTPAECGWYVLDGQHRLEVARRLNLEKVPCAIVEAVDTAAQASAFIGLNCDRVSVNQYALHKAALAAAVMAKEIAELGGPIPVPAARPAPAAAPEPTQPARPAPAAPQPVEMSTVNDVLPLPVNRRCGCGAVFKTRRVSEYACPKCRGRG